MIGGQAFDYLIQCIGDLYEFVNSHVAISFHSFNLTYFDLWSSFTAIVLFVTVILGQIFGKPVTLKFHRNEGDDTL